MDKNYLLYLSGVITENQYLEFGEPNVNQFDQGQTGNDQFIQQNKDKETKVAAINQALQALMKVKPLIKQDADAFVTVMKTIGALQGFLGNFAPDQASNRFPMENPDTWNQQAKQRPPG
jgi:hypothetical protein